jgi:hypothetical protein
MATIVTRAGKGAPLTHNEVDANFTNLNTDKLESGSTAASLTITSADINGGTIDGTVIGGSTPAAISGTTGSFSGNLTVDTDTLFVDAANNRVGIGTSSPTTKLQIAAGSNVTTDYPLTINNSANNYGFQVGAYGLSNRTYGASIVNYNFDIGGAAIFKTNGSERLRITSAGSVGIGTSSPAVKLTSQLASSGVSGIAATAAALFENSGNSDVVIAAGTASKSRIAFADSGDWIIGRIDYDHSDNSMRFGTNGAGENARIDASGNLLVGTTDTNPGNDSETTGAMVFNQSFGGLLIVRRSSNECLTLNRTTTDGDIAVFRKDGTTVGSIGNRFNAMYIHSPDGSGSGLRFASNIIQPCASNGNDRDNVIDLGQINSRFDDIFATNGTIQTSDRNEKQDIEELDEAERRVAVAAKGLLRKFRWKDAVEEKGDDARIHFGIIAQIGRASCRERV